MPKKSNAISFSVSPEQVRNAAAFGMAANAQRFADASTLSSHVLTNIANKRFKPSKNQINCIMRAAQSLGFDKS